ncbi:MAG: tetratricopeptide repeat protein [Phycisphaeraceae bacterium]|nr:tetratricopeptide repeat protein [Phycisphaeraceae bacterium]
MRRSAHLIGWLPFLAVVVALLHTADRAAAQSGALVPERFQPAEPVRDLLSAPWLTDEERRRLRVFHGLWSADDLTDPVLYAQAMIEVGRWDDPVFGDDRIPALLRAEAFRQRGEPEHALGLAGSAATPTAARIRVEALIDLGRRDDALAEVRRSLAQVRTGRRPAAGRDEPDPEETVEAVRLLAIGARLGPQGPEEYRRMMELLAMVHQEIDRLHWPALLTEGLILAEKHNRVLAAQALHQAMALHPRCSAGWRALGRLAIESFDFDGAQRAIAALRRLDPDHPYALLLQAEQRLVQGDPDEAAEAVRDLLGRYPGHREALAFAAAARAVAFDEPGTLQALARADGVQPGAPDAWLLAGRMLSLFRQYDWASDLLREAIRRAPTWSAPRIELGLLGMQAARDDEALAQLRIAIESDPFNKRAANSLALLEEIAAWEERRTDHFIIRYRPGVDRVLVDLMEEPLEEIHRIVGGRFRITPERRTIIEVMPDHERFSVRIAGMPDIHTIAACTGPIIAMEVPREGRPAMHRGVFDWERVLRHEYTHTITLEATLNRIPHWLTEAAAVAMELAPRTMQTCLMLAGALEEGSLFTLENIKWGFVRPRRPGDRSKAYAQSHWMFEFMEERFGPDAIIDLLTEYAHGRRDVEAFGSALGIAPDAFYREFIAWAGEQVMAWGLAPEPSFTALTDEVRIADPDLHTALVASRQARLDAIAEAIVRSIGRPLNPGERPLEAIDWPDLVRPPVDITPALIASWRARFPDHPEILLLDVRRRLDSGERGDDVLEDLRRLTTLRPVDDWPHRRLAEILLAGNDPSAAIPHLEALDVREERSAIFARELSRLYRRQGDLDRAYVKALRAVFIDPYRAEFRETAAAIAVQARRWSEARRHLEALILLEPGREQHRLRLERVNELSAAP